MKRYYGCDAHKKYSIFTCITEDGDKGPIFRVMNDRLQFRSYLNTLPSEIVSGRIKINTRKYVTKMTENR
jgi:hypothetical protein